MIAAELKSGISIVRIHDECLAPEPDGYIKQVDQIVSDSYKRRAKVVPDALTTAMKPRNANHYI